MNPLLSHSHLQELLRRLRAVDPQAAEELRMHLHTLEGQDRNLLPVLVREITESTTLSAAHEQYTSESLQRLARQRVRVEAVLERIARAESEQARAASQALELAETHSQKELEILAFRFTWQGRLLHYVETAVTAVRTSRWTSLLIGGFVVWLLSQLGLSPEVILP